MRKTVRQAIWGPEFVLVGRVTERGEKWHTKILHLNGHAFVEPDVFNRHVLLVWNVLSIAVFCNSYAVDGYP